MAAAKSNDSNIPPTSSSHLELSEAYSHGSLGVALNVPLDAHHGSETPPYFLPQSNHLNKAALGIPKWDVMETDDEGNTLLHNVSQNGNIEKVRELIVSYSKPTGGKNKEGHTPLHLASAQGHTEVVQTLAYKFPADLQVKDNHSDTPK